MISYSVPERDALNLRAVRGGANHEKLRFHLLKGGGNRVKTEQLVQLEHLDHRP